MSYWISYFNEFDCADDVLDEELCHIFSNEILTFTILFSYIEFLVGGLMLLDWNGTLFIV